MRAFAAALAATFAVHPLAARAQLPPGDGGEARPILTLEEALHRAAASNLDLQAARARQDQARAGVAKAWSQQLPQLVAGASYTRNSDGAALDVPAGFLVRDVGTAQGPPPGQGIPGQPTSLVVVPSGVTRVVLQERDQLASTLALSQTLVAPSLWYAIRASEEGASSAEQAVEAARRDVLFATAQAYYGAVSLRKLVEVSEGLLEIALRQERDAENRYRAGSTPRIAPVRARIDRATAEQDLVRARAAYDEARISLGRLLDREPDFDVVEAPAPSLPTDLDALLAGALRDRPDLAAARLAQQGAASQRRAALMRYLPSVGAFGRWQATNATGFGGRQGSWAAGLGLTWSLLDGGTREAEVREASARLAEATALRRAAEARAGAEVREALVELASARANARKAREQADLAAENQRLVEASHGAGAATAVEQADAAAALRNAEVAAAAEELRSRVAALRVLHAAGLWRGAPAP